MDDDPSPARRQVLRAPAYRPNKLCMTKNEREVLRAVRHELRQLVDQSLIVYRRTCVDAGVMDVVPAFHECLSGAAAAAALSLRHDIEAAAARIAALSA